VGLWRRSVLQTLDFLGRRLWRRLIVCSSRSCLFSSFYQSFPTATVSPVRSFPLSYTHPKPFTDVSCSLSSPSFTFPSSRLCRRRLPPLGHHLPEAPKGRTAQGEPPLGVRRGQGHVRTGRAAKGQALGDTRKRESVVDGCKKERLVLGVIVIHAPLAFSPAYVSRCDAM
jgi:hypothetical protein